jgi:O-antigen ligase
MGNALHHNKMQVRGFYALGICYALLNAIAIYFEFYWLLLLPVMLMAFYWAFFSLENLMFFIVFFTPLSLGLENMKELGGIGISVPTDPLMFAVMILFFIKILLEQRFDKKVLLHPLTILIYLQLGWIIITSITSEFPLVSFKFLVSRLWFVVCFYFIATQLFKKEINIYRFLWLYILPLTAVIFYTVIRHSFYRFEVKPSHWVMEPIFKDHTSYGAILALMFPFLFYLLGRKKYDFTIRFFIGFLIFVFTVGLIFSYTRAAWLSLIAALCVALIYRFRIKFWMLASATFFAFFVLAISWNAIIMKLEKNRQDASDELSEHVESMSNISTDASNLERLNRWNSAFRMFKERPVFGWGPGTYAFVYAPFQLSSDLTIISTNAGDLGNAHSEYIGPLAEQGIMGLILILLLVGFIYYKGSQLYKRLPKGDLRNLTLVILASLTTYLTHGVLNNYLDIDKAAVPFWAFIAMLVAIEVYHEDKLKSASEKR